MPRERSRSAPPSFPVVVPSVLDDSEEEETSGLSDLQVRLRKLRRFRKVFNNGQSACADDLTAAKQPAAAAADAKNTAAAAAAAADEPMSYDFGNCEDVDYWLLLQ